MLEAAQRRTNPRSLRLIPARIPGRPAGPPLERLQEPRWEHHFAVAPVALAPGARAQRSRHVRGVGPRPIHQDDGTEAAVAHPPPELGGDVRALEREQPQIEWIEHAWPLAREHGQN